MGRLPHSRSLGIWINGAFAGTWTSSARSGDVLSYDAQWVSSEQGRPFSLSLPFTPGDVPHRGAVVRSYFDNLLPDSQDIRKRIARRFKASTTDAFDLLEQIGRDCVGALQILPEGAVPAGVKDVQAQTLTEAEVAHLLRATVAPGGLGNDDEDEDFRISIAGAQEKTALLLHEGQWCRPHGSTPTTHILKLPLGLVGNMRLDLQESVENEWLCSRILKAYGLPVADCAPLLFEDQKVLCVTRFDRRWADGKHPWLIRLPQEDMCQATGTPPHLKYESDGGPGMDRILDLLRGSLKPAPDRLQFFRAQVLFWLLCATDGHAKNFSIFLRPGGSYDFTPLYDVLSAYPLLGEGPGRLSPHKAKMAMAVRSGNAHWKMRDIQRRHWLALGQRNGIVSESGKDASAVLDELIAATPRVVQAVQKEIPARFPAHVAQSIFEGLVAAADRLAA